MSAEAGITRSAVPMPTQIENPLCRFAIGSRRVAESPFNRGRCDGCQSGRRVSQTQSKAGDCAVLGRM